ncbi:hypothetical protein SELR_00270 [Selenomonas ruminantium subsp. lactilytica TAM6421]|uniref:TadE-like domain-containing protein n=1 Tax=Selenomonas ruminantium subsp. lactilytica (strain NBRC 103574 / TAM6421) TaxID=927704 RepID=I0GLU8_SELRL|nr:TadE family protein [Selenomonas ruminantium]BAL81735.1 hypothetical protein SELR_00270 [Selenomonas ruminantium subsp. lactilytica TAM6421]
MKWQKGQSAVEFALVIPLFLLLILGMIYGGFVYADYLQYSTAVREAARDIAMQSADKRQTLIDGLNSNTGTVVGHYATPLTKLYRPQFSAELKSDPNNNNELRFVTVKVELTRDDSVLGALKPLPEELAPLQCTMPLEKEAASVNNSSP